MKVGRVIGAAHERTGRDVLESFFSRDLAVEIELFWRDEFDYWQMIWRWTQILTHRQNLAADFAQIVHCLKNLRLGFAVVTAQNPQARVQRSPAIMNVAVPWLQHSQRFGHCALSQTVCSRRSEISALVEKKTGFDGKRTLIQDGLCAWCSAGSIFAQDIVEETTATFDS